VARIRKRKIDFDLFLGRSGQSLVEIAIVVPLLTFAIAYAIDFSYLLIVAAALTSAANNAAEYSIQGYLSAAQSSLPTAGPLSTSTSVSALAISGLNSLVSASTTATIQVCSKSIGTAGNATKCSSYGPSGTSYTPATDPEAPRFMLQRVDVTYTVHPPIPLSFFKRSLLPNTSFHYQVSMRALD
jgi:Flp pilus assembly protein TadG